MSTLPTDRDEIELVMIAPRQIGEFAWAAVARQHNPTDHIVDTAHGESAFVPLPFRTLAHETSMAVWNVCTPVVAESVSRVRLGLRCSAGCSVAGQTVHVKDLDGLTVGEAKLGESPLDGTDALYWTELGLVAPAIEGVARFEAIFQSSDLDIPHEASRAQFSCRIIATPQHQVTITVVETGRDMAVDDCEVRFGPYIRSTDGDGRVCLEVPGGLHEVSIRKDGFEAPPTTVHVDANTSLQIRATVVPTMAQLEPELTSFEGFPWG
jgi:hypothetical protein